MARYQQSGEILIQVKSLPARLRLHEYWSDLSPIHPSLLSEEKSGVGPWLLPSSAHIICECKRLTQSQT